MDNTISLISWPVISKKVQSSDLKWEYTSCIPNPLTNQVSHSTYKLVYQHLLHCITIQDGGAHKTLLYPDVMAYYTSLCYVVTVHTRVIRLTASVHLSAHAQPILKDSMFKRINSLLAYPNLITEKFTITYKS